MRAELFTPSSALGKSPAWRARITSLLIHIALVSVLIFMPSFRSKVAEDPPKKEMMVVELAPYKMVYPVSSKPVGGGGGGGERNPVPATKGRLPRFSTQQLSPPSLIRNKNPKLAVEPTVVVPPDIRVVNPDLANYGDPLAKLITDSQGPGSGSGFGTGSGGGVGSGSGPGVGPGSGGGTGGGVYQVGGSGGASQPICIYCPDPRHTEESRKARVKDAVVTLRIVVNEDGSVREAKVVKKLGFGLDEEAIKTVLTWRLKPGEINGKPVAVYILVEVKFNVY